MARGKYKSAAEARRVREEALSEVEAGRRTIVKLTAENGELRETLAAEREKQALRMREMHAMLAETTSPEVEALRRKLQQAETDARNARKRAGLALAEVFRRRKHDVRFTVEAVADLCDALQISPSEFFGTQGTDRRELRRESAKALRRKVGMINELESGGLDPAGIG